MTWHPEVMPGAQQLALAASGPLASGRGFYLAGGTALAIQLGHRRSVDLDWFTSDTLADPLRLAADLREGMPEFAVRSTESGTLHGVMTGVNFSFFEYRYPMLAETVEWPEYSCRLASPEDLACMKLSALVNRGAKKDFIDIFALGRVRFSLAEMLALYQRKFSVRDVGHVLVSLTWYDDAEAEETPELIWHVDWSEVKGTVEGWVKDFTRLATGA